VWDGLRGLRSWLGVYVHRCVLFNLLLSTIELPDFETDDTSLYTVYTVIQEETSIFWDVIVPVILRK